MGYFFGTTTEWCGIRLSYSLLKKPCVFSFLHFSSIHNHPFLLKYISIHIDIATITTMIETYP